VVIPGSHRLTEEFRQALTDYVEQGGNPLLLGEKCARPEIAIEIAPTAELQPGPGGSSDRGIMFLELFLDFLLPNIRWVPDNRIEQGEHDILMTGTVWNPAKSAVRRDFEKILPYDSGIVRFLIDFPGGEVKCRQMSWIEGDIAAEKLGNQIQVRARRIQIVLSIVCTDKKTPGPASRVENSILGIVYAEAIDKVDDITPVKCWP